MGLLKLLTFPVSGPVLGGKWVLQTILDQAKQQHYDVAAIRQQMAELETQYQSGLVSDEEFDRREEALLQRLLEAREYHQTNPREGQP
jgi:cytochrome c-type biogenesis protein CcmI